jgi:hypothetical protein
MGGDYAQVTSLNEAENVVKSVPLFHGFHAEMV